MDVENSNSKNDQEMASMDVQSTEPQALYCGTDLPSPHINLNTAGGSPKSPSSVHGHDETSTDGIITMAMEFFGLTLNRGDEVIVEKVSAFYLSFLVETAFSQRNMIATMAVRCRSICLS